MVKMRIGDSHFYMTRVSLKATTGSGSTGWAAGATSPAINAMKSVLCGFDMRQGGAPENRVTG